MVGLRLARIVRVEMPRGLNQISITLETAQDDLLLEMQHVNRHEKLEVGSWRKGMGGL